LTSDIRMPNLFGCVHFGLSVVTCSFLDTQSPPSTLVSSQEQPAPSYNIVVQGGSVVDTTNVSPHTLFRKCNPNFIGRLMSSLFVICCVFGMQEYKNFKKEFQHIWDK